MLKREIIFKNTLDEVPRIMAFIEELGNTLNLDFAVVSGIKLAIEEAAVNVIKYAYPRGVEMDSSLSVMAGEGALTFVMIDSGVPFDPTSVADPDLTLTAEERPIGGLGIILIKKMMSKVEYLRVDGMNRLTMVLQTSK